MEFGENVELKQNSTIPKCDTFTRHRSTIYVELNAQYTNLGINSIKEKGTLVLVNPIYVSCPIFHIHIFIGQDII